MFIRSRFWSAFIKLNSTFSWQYLHNKSISRFPGISSVSVILLVKIHPLAQIKSSSTDVTLKSFKTFVQLWSPRLEINTPMLYIGVFVTQRLHRKLKDFIWTLLIHEIHGHFIHFLNRVQSMICSKYTSNCNNSTSFYFIIKKIYLQPQW